MARNLGPVAAVILDLLRERGPMPLRQIVAEASITSAIARYTCSRLVASGVLVVIERKRLPQARRDMAIYACAQERSPGLCLHELITGMVMRSAHG